MSERGPRDIRLDQQMALRTAAIWLVDEFGSWFGVETIERYLYASYDEFAADAVISTYLPLIAQRFARQRLLALGRTQGLWLEDKPVVLFLCVHNAGRSQMALGFFERFAGNSAVAWSGGSRPVRAVEPAAVAVMAERGIDIAGEYCKPWTDEVVRAADVVITMGCGDACPIYPGKRYEDWVLDDPGGQSIDAVREIRDEIERRVLVLMDELGLQPVA